MLKEDLEKLCKLNYTREAIAKELGVSRSTVNKHMKTYGLTNKRLYLCKTCGETDETKFYGDRKTACKKCQNKEKHKNQLDNKEFGINYLGGKCCKCGYSRCNDALDFHHIDPEIKDSKFYNIKSWSKDHIMKELDNCILVCANCHREIHSAKYEG